MSVKPSKFWNRISTQLYTGFGGAVVIIIIISLLALSFLAYIGNIQQTVNEKNIPQMASAFAIAQQTAKLVAASPRLIASSPEQFKTVSATVDQQMDAFRTQLLVMMENQGESEQVRQIQSDGIVLIENIERIKLLVRKRFFLSQRSLNLRNELKDIQDEITPIILNEIDDQILYIITGYWSLDEARSPRPVHFSESEFMVYRHLFELREAATVASQLLATAFIVTDVAMLEPLRDQFETTVDSIRRSLKVIEEHERVHSHDSPDAIRRFLKAIEEHEREGVHPRDRSDSVRRSLDVIENRLLHDRLSWIFEYLVFLGEREDNGFKLRGLELKVDNELSALLRENQILEIDIVTQVENVVNDSSSVAGEMTNKAAEVTSTSTKLLLFVNIVSISAAILFGWLIVQRRLIRRLGRISNQMREMADGNLELNIDTKGNDEITQLAKALEVFRYNALEVKRLNLVETLANQLQEKNEELADANEELKRMQDQIVMREKLAALGELTAGVAHEIKNPMNFIMNFSEVSQELLEELLEEIDKIKTSGDTEEEYDPELVEEVAEDLTGNLKRIREHGKRANRIITDMLKMGRGGGEWQPTDLDLLLHEHALLAFHSARASDSEFQLEIQEDYDQDIGEITVQPQDIGRVFLNLVTNACYATDEKRKLDKDYQPTLKLSTKLAGDRIEVHVRDNGTGIPESALERIFNPFYTTKPTDRGTGLGLSLSNDIVREHGGEFRVETKEGEYTDMIVVLPLDPATYQATDTSEEAVEGENSTTTS